MNGLDKGVLDSFIRVQSGLQYTLIRQARTGKRETDGTINPDPTVGLSDGQIWIREGEEGQRGQTVALIVGIRDDIPDLPCLIGENIGGELCAFVPDVNSRSVSVWGSALAAAGNPRTPVEINTVILEGKNLKMGRVRPSIDNPNTMNVWIEPFAMQNGMYWAGGDLDLTSYIPATTGHRAWVLVYIDEDGDADAVSGTSLVMPSNDGMLEGEIADITVPLGATSCGAVALANGQTAITVSNTRFADWGYWRGARMDAGEFVELAGDTMTGDLNLGGNELLNYAERVTAATISSSPHAVDWSAASIYEYLLTTDITLTFSGLVAGRSLTLLLIQDGTGGRSVTFPGSVTWLGGTPIFNTAANTINVVTLFVREDGTSVLGSPFAAVDAADVTFTPDTLADWNSSADPGSAGDALDQLADRVTQAESDISGLSAGGISAGGWVSAGETWTYAGADDPAFTFTVSGDVTTKYSAGMRLRVSQSTGGTKYFIVTKVAYSAPDTTITVYGGTDYNLENEAISSPNFSVVKAPYAFPLDPTKWTVESKDTTARTQASPTSGTWYNLGSHTISIPVGVWNVSYQVAVDGSRTAGDVYVLTTLSTANNTESDADWTALIRTASQAYLEGTLARHKVITLASKTPYYLNVQAGASGHASINTLSTASPAIIRAVCAYL